MRWPHRLYEINKGMNVTQEMARAYEARSKQDVFLSRAPVIVRLYGRNFDCTMRAQLKNAFLGHDAAIHRALLKAAEIVVENLHARLAYVWGHEITLLLFETDPKKDIFCEGRRHKIDSISSGLASLAFNRHGQKDEALKDVHWDDLPHFEGVSFEVPTLEIAMTLLHGYQLDHRRNAAIKLYQLAQPNCKGSNPGFKKAIELAAAKGLLWADLPIELRRGTFLRRWKRPQPVNREIGLGFFLSGGYPRTERPEAYKRAEHLWLHALENTKGWLLDHEDPIEDSTQALDAER